MPLKKKNKKINQQKLIKELQKSFDWSKYLCMVSINDTISKINIWIRGSRIFFLWVVFSEWKVVHISINFFLIKKHIKQQQKQWPPQPTPKNDLALIPKKNL